MEGNWYIAYTKNEEYIGLYEFGTASWLNYIEYYFDANGTLQDTKRCGNGHRKNETVEEAFSNAEEDESSPYLQSLGEIVSMMREIETLSKFDIDIVEQKKDNLGDIWIAFQVKGYEKIQFRIRAYNIPNVPLQISHLTMPNKDGGYPKEWNYYFTKQNREAYFKNEKELLLHVAKQTDFYEELMEMGKI